MSHVIQNDVLFQDLRRMPVSTILPASTSRTLQLLKGIKKEKYSINTLYDEMISL